MSKSSNWIRGNISKKISLAEYTFTEAVYAPETKLSPHSHDYIYFRYVLNGNFTEYCPKEEILSNPATMMFRSTDEVHSNLFHTETRCLTVKFGHEKFKKLTHKQKPPKETAVMTNKNLNQLFTRLYKEMYAIDEYSILTIEGLMLEIIAETFRQKDRVETKKPPYWLLQAKENLDEEFQENITIETLANNAGIHPTYLAGEFKRHFQTTIGDYIRQKRIELARQKLITSNIPISEIALITGFFDQSHFTRVFKKTTGMTPGFYRTKFRTH